MLYGSLESLFPFQVFLIFRFYVFLKMRILFPSRVPFLVLHLCNTKMTLTLQCCFFVCFFWTRRISFRKFRWKTEMLLSAIKGKRVSSFKDGRRIWCVLRFFEKGKQRKEKCTINLTLFVKQFTFFKITFPSSMIYLQA